MGFGPPPVSPMVCNIGAGELTVTVPYDNSTLVIQDAITTHRDAASEWTDFVVFPGVQAQAAIFVPLGESTIALSWFTNLGIVTKTDLDNAGYSAL